MRTTKTCVLGAKGNMGRRYMSILKWMNADHVGVDLGDKVPAVENYIIATPTDQHLKHILDIKDINPKARILCEKPIYAGKDIFALYALKKWDGSIFMVNNYRYMLQEKCIPYGITLYDYYNSGNDGIEWDCIQLIYLSKRDVVLKNESPRWVCQINGQILDRASIDHSYIHMVEDFLRNKPKKLWGYDDIIKAHEKVSIYKGDMPWLGYS